jgi:hypothetical protein
LPLVYGMYGVLADRRQRNFVSDGLSVVPLFVTQLRLRGTVVLITVGVGVDLCCGWTEFIVSGV